MSANLTSSLPQVRSLCQQHGVRRLAAFGSAVDGRFNAATSDLDFVVAFADRTTLDYANRYLDFADALEHLFGRKVDLVTERSVRRPSFRQALKSGQQILYEA